MDGKRAAGRALFGGSFNPPHVGHLRLAIEMAETLRPLADSVELMPCATPPHKVVSGLLPFDLRAAMVEACLDGLPGLSCNRMEAERPGLSYTWDTLQACREETPERPLFFILGNPDYALLPHWHRGLELPELCQLMVVPRGEGSEKNFLVATESMWPGARPCEPVLPGSRRMRLPGGGLVHFVPLPWISVSASRIRHRWLHGLNVDFLVPRPVLDLLDTHRETVLEHWLPETRTDDA